MAHKCFCGLPAFSKGLCITHWKIKSGKPLERKATVKKQEPITKENPRDPIKKVSLETNMQRQKYRKLRLEWLPQHSFCEAKLENCTYFSTQIHHKAGRSNGLLLDTSTFLAVCHNCHVQITNDTAMAIEKNLSFSRNK